MKRQFNRWVCACAGVAVLLGAGLVYAWSVLQQPIAAYFSQWTKAQLSITFTVCMIAFCIGGFIAGALSKKISPRIYLCAAGILAFFGFLLASHADSLGTLYFGYGVLGGLSSGIAYNAVMSVMSRRFMDKQGLISGIMLMGFGLSSFIVGKVYQAMTPSGAGMEAWRSSFLTIGILLMAIYLLSSFFFSKPAPTAAGQSAGRKTGNTGEGMDLTTLQMLRRPSFWLFFAWAVLLSAAGLVLISQSTGIAGEIAPTASNGTIATVVGLISIFNGIGRVCFGGLFDKLGRKKTIWIINLAWFFSIAVLLGAMLIKSFPLLIAGFIFCGFSYGGITPTNSAFINSFYGSSNYPMNFSIINLNLIAASFGSTIAGSMYDATGSYLSAIYLMAGAAILATFASVLIRRP